MIIAPSIIASDFARLGDQVDDALDAGAEWLHVDVMDGRFVPNITVGPLVVKALKPYTSRKDAFLDVHLMIENPNQYLEQFVNAGADVLTVHVETSVHLHRTIYRIKELGVRAGVALNPATPLSAIEEILPDVDVVLVMSVNPGFSFQKYISSSTEKIHRLRRLLDRSSSKARLEVDGGVTAANVGEIARAGADVIVAGNAVFGGRASIRENIHALRQALVVRA